MKKGGSLVLLVLTCLFAVFTGGILLGRSLNTAPVSVQTGISAENHGVTPTQVQTDGRVNINTASSVLLDTLPGIGPVLAQRIVDYRTANGPFPTIEALAEVEGIGSKTLLEIFDLITVGES